MVEEGFACLVGEKEDDRDARYREFVNLYNVRSDIVHGRAHEHHESSENLVRFSNQLQSVWQRVLGDSGIQETLEQEDKVRKIWFMSRKRGYTPAADDN